MPMPEEDFDVFVAIEAGNKYAVLRLLDSDNMSCNPKDDERRSLLHWAAKLGWNDVIERTIERMQEQVTSGTITEKYFQAALGAVDIHKYICYVAIKTGGFYDSKVCIKRRSMGSH